MLPGPLFSYTLSKTGLLFWNVGAKITKSIGPPRRSSRESKMSSRPQHNKIESQNNEITEYTNYFMVLLFCYSQSSQNHKITNKIIGVFCYFVILELDFDILRWGAHFALAGAPPGKPNRFLYFGTKISK